MTDETEVICTLGDEVFGDVQSERYHQVRRQMQTAMRGWKELKNGYALSFPMEAALFMTLAEFITLERKCCPFSNSGWRSNPARTVRGYDSLDLRA